MPVAECPMPTTTDELDLLRSAAREALKPSEPLTVAAWADRYRLVPATTSQRPGPWRTQHVPYTREIMDAFNDPRVRTISVMKGTQVAGTESLLNMVLYTIQADPGPWLLVYPSSDLAAKFSTERLIPSVEASPAVRARLRGDPRRDLKTLQLSFDRCAVYLTGSQSESKLAMLPVRYVGFDEIDSAEFDPRALVLGRERTRTYTRAKIVQLSKPSFYHAGIHAQFLLSDQRRYFCPCPACGHYHTLRFSDIRWEGGRTAPLRVVRDTARWVCPTCRQPAPAHAKRGMIERGRWISRAAAAEARSVGGGHHGEDRRDERGVHAAIAPERIELAHARTLEGDGGAGQGVHLHAGFHLPSLLSPDVPFDALAAKFVDLGRMDRDFVNGELGEPWEESADRIEAHELSGLRAAALAASTAPAPGRAGRVVTRLVPRGGDLPEGVVALYGGIDLQAASAYWALWGFTAMGRCRQLVAHGVVPVPVEGAGGENGTAADTALAPLNRLVSLSDGLVYRAADGLPIRPAAWGIDSGDRTEEVYRWAVTNPHVLATKGRSSMSMDGSLAYKTVPLAAALQELKGAPRTARPDLLKFLGFNADRYKERLFGLLRASMGETPRAEGLGPRAEAGRAGLPPVVLPLDVPEEFLRQLTAEQLTRREVKTARGARVVTGWSLRPGVTANHYLDATVIAYAVADAVGIAQVTDEAYAARRQRVAMAGGTTPAAAEGRRGTLPAPPSRSPEPVRQDLSESGYEVEGAHGPWWSEGW